MTATHHLILMLFLFCVGLCVGSFLNVCIYRIPAGLCVIRPRSRCPKCGSPIRARDNIPVLSWILLGGKCRDCRAAISARYAIVELAIGGLFAAVYLVPVAISPTYLWDRAGLLGVLSFDVLCCVPLGVLIAIFLIKYDRRLIAGAVSVGNGVGRQD
jgi:leader peptidase (prepilin peptidase)/N-methyltransferase